MIISDKQPRPHSEVRSRTFCSSMACSANNGYDNQMQIGLDLCMCVCMGGGDIERQREADIGLSKSDLKSKCGLKPYNKFVV